MKKATEMRFKHFVMKMSLVVAFFIPVMASAQTGHFVILDQGHLDQSYGLPNGKLIEASIYVGNGWTGSTTGAYLAGTSSGGSSNGIVSLLGCSDSAYSSCSVSCEYMNNGAPSVDGLVQLDYYSGTAGGCILQPSLYYKVNVYQSNYIANVWSSIQGTTPNTTGWLVTYSTSTANDVVPAFDIPYFVIVGQGFQVTPSNDKSGINLSGAQGYCNQAFASSTGIGATFGNGLCVGFGYLFIPTQESLNFGGLTSQIMTRFPFEWFGEIQSIWSGAYASSTDFYEVTWNLHDLVASSTDPMEKSMAFILPNITVFSSSTVTHYLSPSQIDTFKNLERWMLWGGLATDVYFLVLGIW